MAKTGNKATDHLIIKKYTEHNLAKWFYDVFVDWFVILLTIAGATYIDHLAIYILALFIIGNRQHALGILGHEGTHYCLSKNKTLNDNLSNLFCFFPLGFTASGYRSMHFAHHSHTNEDRDPEVMHKRARADQWALPLKISNLFRNCFKDLFGNSLIDYVFIIANAKPSSHKEYLFLLLPHIVLLTVCVTSGTYFPLLLWYIPLVTTFMMFFRLRVWLEHQGESHTNRLKLSRMEGAILAPHNIWYHYEHHAFPTVPYYNLPKVRAQMGEIQKTKSLAGLIRELREYSVPVASA